jgi:hypothetical protein
MIIIMIEKEIITKSFFASLIDYFGGIQDHYNNYLAIDYILQNKFPDIHDAGINMNYWIISDGFVSDINEYKKNYPIDEIQRTNRCEYVFRNKEYVDRIYKNTILTRLWFKKQDKEIDVNVLMELGIFSYNYLMKINNPHDFN